MVRELWNKYIVNHCVAIHAMRDVRGEVFSFRPLIVFATAAVSLSYIHYYGYKSIFINAFGKYFTGSPCIDLYGQLFWSASCSSMR